MKQRKKIIFDCDNTMGIKGCDVDDGLALLYLLGEGSAQICGITTTFGNNVVDVVYDNTQNMLKELGQTHIPVLKGCPESLSFCEGPELIQPPVLNNEAVDFLVQTINENPHEISILATGSLTNLLGAYARDPEIFDKIPEIVLMGGITEDLIIGGKILKELNFSCDPRATERVLKEGGNLSIITGNHCLDAYFKGDEFMDTLQSSSQGIGPYLLEKCTYWFHHMMDSFDLDGFYNWDVVAAAYLIKPELFRNNYRIITPCAKDLAQGELKYCWREEEASLVNLPKIAKLDEFKEEIYKGWLNVKMPRRT